MPPLTDIVRAHGLNISYADNTQLILSLSEDPATTQTNFHRCMTSVADWMKDNCLKLNTDKTEVLIFGNTTTPWNDSW